jgi:hypothetical protein
MPRCRRPLVGPLTAVARAKVSACEASAGRLAGLANDVHLATRLLKHLIMGAVVNVLDRFRD